MNKKRALIILGFIIVLCIGFVAGMFTQQLKTGNIKNNSQTFYAEIKEVHDSNFLVEGLSVNDINYRGLFSFSIKDSTVLLWRGTKIDLADLDVGDHISITFRGEILESYPAIINNVTKIQLLDDEK